MGPHVVFSGDGASAGWLGSMSALPPSQSPPTGAAVSHQPKPWPCCLPPLHISSLLPSPPASPLSLFIVMLDPVSNKDSAARPPVWKDWCAVVTGGQLGGGALKWGPEGRVKGAARWPGDVREGVSVGSDLG